MTHRLQLALSALAAACVCALAVIGPAPAATAAATKAPCWKTLINDWYDGRIDNIYPIPCYQQAINHLPQDIQVYSSAREDIKRALALAINYKNHPKTAPKPYVKATSPAPSAGTSSSGSSGSSTGTASSPGNKPAPGIPTALKNSSPGGATSFPLPLIILGGLALFLLAAGAVGLIIRRMQGRGPGTPGTP